MNSGRLTRRALLSSCPILFTACSLDNRNEEPLLARLGQIHERIGGRLGVHALDTATGRRIGLDDTSRYTMASTFKLLLAAMVLSRADQGTLDMEQRVSFGSKDMLSHAPVTSQFLERGWMTVRQLCEAIITESDNPAANLLLDLIGGPGALTDFLRTLGDPVTRLDRKELELNTNLPGDPRDTTTPRAMVDTTRKILTGAVLEAPARLQLIAWLKAARTGLDRIRAGLPAIWQVGDKTGTGANSAVNDVAIAWPPDRAPLLIAIYTSESALGTNELNAAHAEIAGVIATWAVR